MNLGTACGTSKDRFILRSRVRGSRHGYRSRCRACAASPHPSPPLPRVVVHVGFSLRITQRGIQADVQCSCQQKNHTSMRTRKANIYVPRCTCLTLREGGLLRGSGSITRWDPHANPTTRAIADCREPGRGGNGHQTLASETYLVRTASRTALSIEPRASGHACSAYRSSVRRPQGPMGRLSPNTTG